MCVIDGRRGPHPTANFPDLPYPMSSFRGRRGEPRGYYPRRQPGHRGLPQVQRVWPINFQLLPRTKSFLCVHKSKRRLQGTVFKKKKKPVLLRQLKCHQTCFQGSLTVFGNIRPACTLEHVWKAWRDSAVEIKAFQHFEECLELSLLIFQASLYLRLMDAFHRKNFFS